jgi:hypothetical protein
MAQHLAQFGIVFLLLGFAATFLMYHLWGYPFDKATRTSGAPRWAMYLHRILGYMFAAVYVLIMMHMVPRLWEYQVEFPARTTAHIVLGITVGFLLVIKISIMRFFRHFEEWMPYLGTAILFCSVLLLGLSIPFVFQERALAATAPGGHAYSQESRDRVAMLLPSAGMPGEVDLTRLSSEKSLRRGRSVLLGICVKCHDLKTILAKPRTPSGWFSTVQRMAEKPALFAPIKQEDEYAVTAYLVAITPDLQKSIKLARKDKMDKAESVEAMEDVEEAGGDTPREAPATEGEAAPGGEPAAPAAGGEPAEPAAAGEPAAAAKAAPAAPPKPRPAVASLDPVKAAKTYEQVCSQCHELSDVDDNPPKSRKQVDAIIRRMVEENELEASKSELALCRFHLIRHFVEGK